MNIFLPTGCFYYERVRQHICLFCHESAFSPYPLAALAIRLVGSTSSCYSFFKIGGEREANIALIQIGIILSIYERLSELYDILPMFVYQVCAKVGVYKIGVGS